MIQLRATKFQRAFTLGCVFVIPLVFILFFVIAWRSPQPPPKYVTVFLLVVPAVMVYSYGSVATKLTIENDGQMKWSSLFYKRSIRLADIRSIDVRRWNRGFITVRTPGTRLFMYRDMPGAIEAMKTIANGNPTIELKE